MAGKTVGSQRHNRQGIPHLRTLTTSDKVFHILNYGVLLLFTLVVLYPILWVLSASFSSGEALIKNQVWLWPVGFNISAYKAAFSHPMIIPGFLNSLFYAAVSCVFCVSLTLVTAYPLSRADLPGRNVFLGYFVVTMFFGGGLIPSYLLIRDIGWMNTFLAVTVAFAFSCYNVIIARTYFNSNIPDELLEAAKVDGCGDIKFFLRIVLPLTKPLIAVMVLFSAVANWNGYMSNLLYFTDSNKNNLQMVLRDLLFVLTMTPQQRDLMDPTQLMHQENLARLLKYAVIYIGAAPMLLLYPFIQKHFVKGVMVGAIKG